MTPCRGYGRIPSKGFSRADRECSPRLPTYSEGGTMQSPWVVVRREAYDSLLRAYDRVLAEADESRRLAQALMGVSARKDEMLWQASIDMDYLLGKAMLGEEYAVRLETRDWRDFDRRDWLRRWRDKRLFCFKCGQRERMVGGVLCEPCVNALKEYSVMAWQEDGIGGKL